jgi:beta-N-acetylhexosaminidase
MSDSIEALAGRVICAGFPGRTLPEALAQRLAADALGGVILFKRNLGKLDEVAGLIESVHAASATTPPRSHGPTRAPLVAIDQEGGRVARLGAPIVKLPPMRRLGERGDATLTERCGAVLGAQLAACGINVDFAPVLDVDTNPDNPVIGDRSFGRDADTVITHALAFARGLAKSGVASCGKHFPGHGDTDLDSHLALPRIAHDRARLERVELAPFRAARGVVPSIMTAHVVFDALDREVPAFDRWGAAESGVRAIEAGCDLVLVCSRLDLVEEVASALTARAHADAAFAARLTDAAARVDAMRARFPARALRGDALVDRITAAGGAALEAELG